MAVDLQRLFDQYGVAYVTSGPNVARGHIAIKCPWCGSADPSEHMSVSIEGKGWRCYRNHIHAGRSAARLLAAAANMHLEQAKRVLGESVFVPDDFMGAVKAQLNPPSKRSRHHLELPKEFREFREGAFPSMRPYINYLRDRDYDLKDIYKLTKRHDIRYATSGPYQGRIIFPVYFEGRLVSWVGRTISKKIELRYKALGTKETDEPRALGPLPDYLLWFDDLLEIRNCSTLIFCEGPFDALKIWTIGRRLGIVATCFFTSAPSDAQIDLARELVPHFKRRLIMGDRGTLPLALRSAARMAALGIKAVEPPRGFKDPGELDRQALQQAME